MGFSEQLKKARMSIGYTQQEVANLMGISKSTYCGYETGKRQPDVAKIKQLSKILNTSGDALLETGFQSNSTHIDLLSSIRKNISNDDLMDLINVELGPDILQAIHLFYRLDATDRGAALERMRVMLENEKYFKQEESKHA